jgi:hypothetical protein
MPTSLILVTSYDPGYLSIYEHLVRSERAAGNHPLAFDISWVLSTPVDSYHRGILRALRLEYPGHDIGARLVAAGAEYRAADAQIAPDELLPLDDGGEATLALALNSAIITFSRTDRPNSRNRWIAKTLDGLTREGRVVFRRVIALCAERPDITLAYVPNGRFPHQRMAVEALAAAGVATRHFEKGRDAFHAYVADYSPHDRFRSQGSVDQVLAGLDDAQIESLARDWLTRRAPAASSTNEYSTLWTSELPPAVAAAREAGAKLAGFFTSSQDEFQFQGPEWQLHEWDDQWVAFDAMMSRLEELGYRCYLRVHPNLSTRAHDYFERERAGVRWLATRHPELIVLWHDDPANSYTLLEVSAAVVTWASTIGLEASARGIPVWAGAVTYFGLVADVHELLSPAELQTDGMRAWTVDTGRALRFIAYLVRREQELLPGSGSWIPWTGSRPLGATIASVAVSGGTPGVGQAIWSLVDQYRHRSIRASRRLRRAR